MAVFSSLACNQSQDPASAAGTADIAPPVAIPAVASTSEKVTASEPRPSVAAAAPDAEVKAAANVSGDVSHAGADDNASFRVMTWNLEWFFDDEPDDNYSQLAKEQTSPSREKWDWKRDSVAASVYRADPSVVAFQEIENRRVLWYLSRALSRNHQAAYREICIEGDDVFTEQDVGFVYRADSGGKLLSALQIEPVLSAVLGRSAAMRRDKSMAEVSKHLLVDYELSHGDATETVSILTLHLRAREEAVGTRTKQARTIHAWMEKKIRSGENVIVLGDVNTEETQFPALPGTDMAAICGLDTPDTEDDLIDLHDRLPPKDRQTHLLPGKAFDRILISPALLEDAPSRIDLSFTKMEQLKELSTKGSTDVPDEHWNNYWSIDDAERDISDHWPLMATFEFK